MSTANYKWLIVGEGNFDVSTFTELLVQFGVNVSEIRVRYAGRKGNVFFINNWPEKPKEKRQMVSQFDLKGAQGMSGFESVILVVDSDENENLSQNYARYSKECQSSLVDYSDWQQPKEIDQSIMRLDTIKGVGDRELPIYGLCVPSSGQGCLETDLLHAYGYPVKDEDYNSFAGNIRSASQSWGVEKSSDGKEWWDTSRNGKARMDKFMYVALKEGFKVNELKTKLPKEPQIITNIKRAMNLNLSTS